MDEAPRYEALPVDGEGQCVDVVGLGRDGVASPPFLVPFRVSAWDLLEARQVLLRLHAERRVQVVAHGRCVERRRWERGDGRVHGRPVEQAEQLLAGQR